MERCARDAEFTGGTHPRLAALQQRPRPLDGSGGKRFGQRTATADRSGLTRRACSIIYDCW